MGQGMLRPHYVHASHQSSKTVIASYACGDEPRARFWCQTSRQVALAPDIGGPQDPPDGLRVAETMVLAFRRPTLHLPDECL
jgi:hypothetical protein